MKSLLKIRVDEDLVRLLARFAKRTGRTRSDLARVAIRRYLARLEFEELRGRVLPFAEARGYVTDDEVLRNLRR